MSTSAATQAAGVYGLAYHILKCAQLDYGNSSLVAAARSNRFLGSVALDVLWEAQESLLPLFQVLSHLFEVELEGRAVWDSDQEVWDEGAEPDYLRAMHLVDPVTPADWERLQSYARRIKSIEDGPLRPYEWFDIHLGPLVTFEGLFNAGDENSVLLPNIRRLDLGPRTISLFERFDFWPETGKNAHLILRERDSEPKPVPNLRFCRLDQLQMLGILADVHLEMLPALRVMPVLEELHLKFEPETSNPNCKVSYDGDDDETHGLTGRRIKADPAPGFHALKTLRLTDPVSMRDFTITLKNMVKGSLKLEQLHIRGWDIHEYGQKEASKGLHAAIRACCDKTALTHLTVVLQGWRSDSSTPEMVQDLLAFPNITHACIDFDGHRHLDTKGAFDAFTNAWRHLESLTFFHRPAKRWVFYKTMIDLEDLTCLADRCPRLAYLSIPINLEVTPKPVSLAAPPLTCRSVILNLGCHEDLSRMSPRDTSAVAKFLASVFPYPTLASVTYDFYEPRVHPWHIDLDDIEGELPALATFDDPSDPRREQWLSRGDLLRIAGISRPQTGAASVKPDRKPAKPVMTKQNTKTKVAASRKPATGTAKAAEMSNREPRKSNGTGSTPTTKQSAAGRKAGASGAKAAPRTRKPTALPTAVDPAAPLALFYDAGGHLLRAKRPLPPQASQNQLAAKRQCPQAAKVGTESTDSKVSRIPKVNQREEPETRLKSKLRAR
ncbi:hypothetical protein GGF50DRAFT_115159 [Schizophyllum commune]